MLQASLKVNKIHKSYSIKYLLLHLPVGWRSFTLAVMSVSLIMIIDVESRQEAQIQYENEEKSHRRFITSISEWIQSTKSQEPYAEDVRPEDSISDIQSTMNSRKPRSGSNVSRGSRMSSASAKRVEEVTKRARLVAEAKSLKKQQALEQQKLLLQQEEKRLQLETEIVKSSAKERVLAEMEKMEFSDELTRKSMSSRIPKFEASSTSVMSRLSNDTLSSLNRSSKTTTPNLQTQSNKTTAPYLPTQSSKTTVPNLQHRSSKTTAPNLQTQSSITAFNMSMLQTMVQFTESKERFKNTVK